MTKRLTALLLLLAALLALTGCTAAKPGKEPEPERVSVTMYLWDKAMTKQLTPWLEEQFPDIDLTFVTGYNTMAYYTDLFDRGGVMPDIITCRRFSLNDAAHLSDQLMDLSQTEILGTFYSSYIDNNREPGGAIRWLPMCAEVDGYIANKDLFDQYGIPLPTNYAEFVDALNRFEELGIRGFTTDWRSDYTCLETMQGHSIPLLMSLDGTTWRRAYESETAEEQVGLDDKIWPQVFTRFEQYLKDVRVRPEETEYRFAQASGPYRAGELAIMRGTANDCYVVRKENGINSVMLPYFGETSEDNWILTYPLCQLAVSRQVEESPAKKDAVMRILDAIFSEEGQLRLASGAAVLSYNKTVNIEMDRCLDYVKECVDRNHMYMRLASTEFFAISKSVAHKMIHGEYGAEGAYEDFNAQLISTAQAAPGDVLLTQETAYPLEFGEHGIPSASSLLNTIRSGTDDQIAIGYSYVASSPIFTGEYTEQQLKWLMSFKTTAFRGEYTGEEVRRIMEWLVNVKEDGSNPIRHYNNMPVTSGMEYTVRDNGDGTYTLGNITCQGKPLDEKATYKVLLLGEDAYIESVIYCNCPMPEDLKAKRQEQHVGEYNSYDSMFDGVAASGQLLAPTDYVTILR